MARSPSGESVQLRVVRILEAFSSDAPTLWSPRSPDHARPPETAGQRRWPNFGTPQAPVGWPLTRLPLMLETSTLGIFAAGDVRYRSVKRVASAVGEGAMAVQLVHEYLGELDS